jgi:hypothetical protein
MSAQIRADGDTWTARLGDQRPGAETRPVLFFCTTTDQRPYRVVEVPADRFDGDDDLDELAEDELRDLFADSRSMDFPREYPKYTA